MLLSVSLVSGEIMGLGRGGAEAGRGVEFGETTKLRGSGRVLAGVGEAVPGRST